MSNSRKSPEEKGIALFVTLIALSLVSLLGLYMTLNATTGLHISDNYESRLQATYAAQAGLNHARVLLRGLVFNDLLKGPDGSYTESPLYMEQARSYGFRNPLPLATAQSLDIFNPVDDIWGISDDGLISTGFYGGTSGTALIPMSGISQMAPNPYGTGTIVTSRYFVKVTDNNREASEVAGDLDDNPFSDGDGTVIVRSMGIARTISETTGSVWRRNSVVVFEGRFKRLSTFDLGPALVVQGNQLVAAFDGTYEVSGGLFPGIGAIDTDRDDSVLPDQLIRDAAGGSANITGGGLPNPSIQDITGQILFNKDKSLLLSPNYLWDFIRNRAPRISDSYHDGNQDWFEGSAPYAGAYDLAKPANAPGQDPRVVMVNGDLRVTGDFSGGGLLIVTGNFSYTGQFAYNGLVLLIGSGHLTAAGSGSGIFGSIFLANLTNTGGEISFGIPQFSISGDSRITANRDAVRMAVGLIPPSQISYREIAGSDP
jgi:hypothetical protein